MNNGIAQAPYGVLQCRPAMPVTLPAEQFDKVLPFVSSRRFIVDTGTSTRNGRLKAPTCVVIHGSPTYRGDSESAAFSTSISYTSQYNHVPPHFNKFEASLNYSFMMSSHLNKNEQLAVGSIWLDHCVSKFNLLPTSNWKISWRETGHGNCRYMVVPGLPRPFSR
jgi:hypothetical protein